ncbi:MAG: hypothetical protein ACK5TK_05910 [Betaproteobacteria bacterium]
MLITRYGFSILAASVVALVPFGEAQVAHASDAGYRQMQNQYRYHQPPHRQHQPQRPVYQPQHRPTHPVPRTPQPRRGFEDFGGNAGKFIRKEARDVNAWRERNIDKHLRKK